MQLDGWCAAHSSSSPSVGGVRGAELDAAILVARKVSEDRTFDGCTHTGAGRAAVKQQTPPDVVRTRHRCTQKHYVTIGTPYEDAFT